MAVRPAPVPETDTRTAVAGALTELRAAEEYAGAAADDAHRIGAEWNEVATSLATPGPSDEALAAVEAARAALAERREELAAARLAVGHGPVSPENAAVIGHLHTEVTNAQARADRPFPGSAARRRLAEAEAAEAKFLEDLGFSSYTAYLLDTVVDPADPEPLRRLSNAERAVAEAEVAWQNVAPVADELYVHQSLQRQATQLQERAAALLGFDPGNAVAEHLADWPESCARLTEARAELQRVLRAAGIAPDLDPAATAETWLAARQAEASEHAALEAQLADIEAELAALERAAADRANEVEARRAEAVQAARNADESLDAYLSAPGWRPIATWAAIGSLPLILEDTLRRSRPGGPHDKPRPAGRSVRHGPGHLCDHRSGSPGLDHHDAFRPGRAEASPDDRPLGHSSVGRSRPCPACRRLGAGSRTVRRPGPGSRAVRAPGPGSRARTVRRLRPRSAPTPTPAPPPAPPHRTCPRPRLRLPRRTCPRPRRPHRPRRPRRTCPRPRRPHRRRPQHRTCPRLRFLCRPKSPRCRRPPPNRRRPLSGAGAWNAGTTWRSGIATSAEPPSAVTTWSA